MKLIKNKAQCKNCLEIIESTYRHDWVCCSCYRNELGNSGIFIDGGVDDYCRRGGNLDNFINKSEYKETDEFEDEDE